MGIEKFSHWVFLHYALDNRKAKAYDERMNKCSHV